MSEPLSLESIAKEISNTDRFISPSGKVDETSKITFRIANKVKFTARFGEVIEAFQSEGTVNGVSRKTGLHPYTLNKYFFHNKEFCDLLRATNETIFLEATREIRDRQEDFLKRAAFLAEDALDKMEQLLHESDNEHIQFKVAQDLLDRDSRLSRTKRLEGSGSPVRVDVKILQLAAQTAREIENYDYGQETPREENNEYRDSPSSGSESD